jgi:hypothetical protein
MYNKNMTTIEKARLDLEQFLGDTMLTFSIKNYSNGEWTAYCNEIPAIMTGGMGVDISTMDRMIRDAILTAAGVDPDLAEEVLKFTGLNPELRKKQTEDGPVFLANNRREAEYAIA